MKTLKVAKSCLFLVLAALSFSAFADDPVYVGNPVRPDTIWVPGQCNCAGFYRPGHYLKFNVPVYERDLVWVQSHYDSCGNWVPAHYFVDCYKGSTLCHYKRCGHNMYTTCHVRKM